MDTSKMRKVTVAWLAENDDTGWRSNGLRTDLPRAFINVGTLGEAWFEVASVHDPLPSWTVGADGLYTVFLTDESLDSLALEGDYPAWLDEGDLQPLQGWSDELDKAFDDLTNELERNNLLEEIKRRPPMLLELDIERELEGKPSPFAPTNPTQLSAADDDAPASLAPSPVPDRWLGELPLSPTVCILHVYREEEGFVHDVYGVFASRAIARAHGNKIMDIPDAPLAWELGDDGSEFAHVGKLRLALTNWAVSSERPIGGSEAG